MSDFTLTYKPEVSGSSVCQITKKYFAVVIYGQTQEFIRKDGWMERTTGTPLLRRFLLGRFSN